VAAVRSAAYVAAAWAAFRLRVPTWGPVAEKSVTVAATSSTAVAAMWAKCAAATVLFNAVPGRALTAVWDVSNELVTTLAPIAVPLATDVGAFCSAAVATQMRAWPAA